MHGHHLKNNISLVVPDEYRFYSGSTTPTVFEGWSHAPHVQKILPGISEIKHHETSHQTVPQLKKNSSIVESINTSRNNFKHKKGVE